MCEQIINIYLVKVSNLSENHPGSKLTKYYDWSELLSATYCHFLAGQDWLPSRLSAIIYILNFTT